MSALHLVSLLSFVVFIQAAPLPEVAIQCGKPVYYVDLNSGLFVKHDVGFNTCLEGESLSLEVLRICRTTYTDFEVESVSETTVFKFIPELCNDENEHNDRSCYGRQFLCREQNFLTRSLLVPANCTFDTYTSPRQCLTQPDLQTTAQRLCSAKKSTPFHLNDYRVVPPLCRGEIDKYSTVEFVCCPLVTKIPTSTDNQNNDEKIIAYEQTVSSICHEPPESGPCFRSIEAWYYDAKRETCLEFLYGGCKPGKNNFPSKDECLKTCSNAPVESNTKNSDEATTDDTKRTFFNLEVNETADQNDLLGVVSGSGLEDEDNKKGGDKSGVIGERIVSNVPFLIGGEPRMWLNVHIDPIDYLDEDFVVEQNSNEHDAYTKAKIQLEDSYEQKMATLMHIYEQAERKFVDEVQSSQEMTVQLTDAFQKEVVTLYEKATHGLETEFKDMKARITQKHRNRVRFHDEKKLDDALDTVQSYIPVDKESPVEILDQPKLMSALTKYLDIEQQIMKDDLDHYRRISKLSYSRASVEHRQITDGVFTAHEDGSRVIQKVQNIPYLSQTFTSQLDVIREEFDDYFESVMSEIKEVTKKFGIQTSNDMDDNSNGGYFKNNNGKQDTTGNPVVEIQQSGMFATKYIDNSPGILRSETYEKNTIGGKRMDGRDGYLGRSGVIVILFMCVIALCSVVAAIVVLFRRRAGRGFMGRSCSNPFMRISNSPHPLSPEEKYINSLQVNGYNNPIYKFFDEPQDNNSA